LSEVNSYENIRYWEEECWRKYFIDILGQLYRTSSTILAIKEYLSEKLNKPLHEILADNALFKILLGGLKEDGCLSEDGLAVFCNKFFGTKIDKFDEFIGRLKAGIPIQKACTGLSGMIEPTPFLNTVDKVVSSLKTISGLFEEKGLMKLKIEETKISHIDDPREVCEKVRDFIQACLNVLPHYNPQTFFITSLYRITRKYMKLAYPKLSNEETFNYIKKLLGLSEIIIPEVPDENIKNEYTLWGFDKGSVGYEITINLVNAIFDIMDLDFVQKFFNIKSERKIYLERALNAWHKTLQPSIWSDIMKELYYIASYGSSLVGIYRLDYSTKYPGFAIEGYLKPDGINLKHDSGKTILLTRFLDYVSPQLFLNIGLVDKWYDKIKWQVVVILER
jgi:hypothetical protein